MSTIDSLLDPASPVWFMALKYCDHCGAINWAPIPRIANAAFLYRGIRCNHCDEDKAWVLAHARNFHSKPLVILQREWEMTDARLRIVEPFSTRELEDAPAEEGTKT